jgi:hypothetical protein
MAILFSHIYHMDTERNEDSLDFGDNEEIPSIIIRELLQDFIGNLCRHKGLVEELCIIPIRTYISDRARTITRLSCGFILAIVALQILIVLIVWDVRKTVRRAFRFQMANH